MVMYKATELIASDHKQKMQNVNEANELKQKTDKKR